MFEGILNLIHHHLIFGMRTKAISESVARHLPEGARVLDVGAGDGTIDSLILVRKPSLDLSGIDVLLRPVTRIPVVAFDGRTIPYGDGVFDAVIFLDVLHHTDSPRDLLAEARRVCRGRIVVKDHLVFSGWSWQVLRFMDWVGNRGHRVRLPYNYLRREEWLALFADLGLEVRSEETVRIYPFPGRLIFSNRYQVLWVVVSPESGSMDKNRDSL